MDKEVTVNENRRYNDTRFINRDTISSYANTNETLLQGQIRGIILELPGLGGGSCLGGSMQLEEYRSPQAVSYAEDGIIMAYMRPGPWSWGNCGSMRMTEAVAQALLQKYDLAADTPVVVCGGSMGGLGALNFAAHTGLSLRGVAAACPCVDVFGSFDKHPEFPCTLISAAACYDMPLEEALKRFSPVENVDRMPKVPYFICSDGDDTLCPEEQCDQYVETLKSRGHSVIYHRQPGLEHGGFFPEVYEALFAFMRACILQG